MPRFTTLDIFIKLGQHDSQGGCVAIDKRTFELEIDDEICDDELLTCVMHEMVHVWQHATGKLKEKKGRTFWYDTDLTDLPYLNQPWEEQAYEMQETLLEKWNECNKSN